MTKDDTLNTAHSTSFHAKSFRATLLFGLAAGFSFCALPARAQQDAPPFGFLAAQPPSTTLIASSSLPDAPGAVSVRTEASSSSVDFAAPANLVAFAEQAQPLPKMASGSDKYIAPGQPVPSLTVGNKIALGIKDAISPLSAIGWVITAGYEQGTNGSPNYGTNGKAFAQRLGAAAARSTSEGIFSDSIMDSVLHEDPRYYRMGPGNNFLKRTAYSVTRTLVTRTDGGRSTPNFALLAGTLGGSYLTKAYYPPLNQSTTEVFKTFGGSLGGDALGFFVSEFLSGALNIFHISKPTAN